ncbi:hypothetical protein [Actinoplanes sp. NPDC049118]|uniref:DUF7674 family protein n=1 Tax=Actinoplanes sp. NPDC049118 TaxID=3155769 RepID=UPI0033CE37C0
MTEDERMVEDLVSRFPALLDSYEYHMHDHDVPVPHIFFWEVAQEVVAAFLAGDEASLDWKAVLAFLEEQMERGVPEITTVVVTSFLWYMPYPGKPGNELTKWLGPAMAAGFKRVRPAG